MNNERIPKDVMDDAAGEAPKGEDLLSSLDLPPELDGLKEVFNEILGGGLAGKLREMALHQRIEPVLNPMFSMAGVFLRQYDTDVLISVEHQGGELEVWEKGTKMGAIASVTVKDCTDEKLNILQEVTDRAAEEMVKSFRPDRDPTPPEIITTIKGNALKISITMNTEEGDKAHG